MLALRPLGRDTWAFVEDVPERRGLIFDFDGNVVRPRRGRLLCRTEDGRSLCFLGYVSRDEKESYFEPVDEQGSGLNGGGKPGAIIFPFPTPTGPNADKKLLRIVADCLEILYLVHFPGPDGALCGADSAVHIATHGVSCGNCLARAELMKHP